MAWYAVRTLYRFGIKADGTSIFEERIVCFEADSFDDAYQKAAAEAASYAQSTDADCFPEVEAYEQDGAPLIDGYELWSELYEGRESMDEFWRRRYGQYKYHPD
jgi:hypothetical protein